MNRQEVRSQYVPALIPGAMNNSFSEHIPKKRTHGASLQIMSSAESTRESSTADILGIRADTNDTTEEQICLIAKIVDYKNNILSFEKAQKLIRSASAEDLNKWDDNCTADETKGLTPLCYAAKYNLEEIVSELVSTGRIDVNKSDENGTPALWHASRYRNIKCVKALCSVNSISVNQPDSNGQTPLITACTHVHPGEFETAAMEIVEYLVCTCHAKIEAKDNEGATALFYAVQLYTEKRGKEQLSIKVAQFLHSQGADIRTICRGHCESAWAYLHSLEFLSCGEETKKLLNQGSCIHKDFIDHYPLRRNKVLVEAVPLIGNSTSRRKSQTNFILLSQESQHRIEYENIYYECLNDEISKDFYKPLMQCQQPSSIPTEKNIDTAVNGLWVQHCVKKFDKPLKDFSLPKTETYLLPILNMSGHHFLYTCVKATVLMSDARLFENECVCAAVTFAWRARGRYYHLCSLVTQAIYLFFLSFSVYTYPDWIDNFDDNNGSKQQFTRTIEYIVIIMTLGSALHVVILILHRHFLDEAGSLKEAFHMQRKHHHYVDMYTGMNLAIIPLIITAMLMRLMNGAETDSSAACLAIGCLLVWFKSLYYLRPYQPTAALVKMIFYILSEVKWFFFVFFILLVGFSQALFLVARGEDLVDYSTPRDALLSTFSFVASAGNNAPQLASSSNLASFLQIVLVLTITILLLNLLIALMNSAYRKVESNFAAEHRLEQTRTMLDHVDYRSIFSRLISVIKNEEKSKYRHQQEGRFLVCLRRMDDAQKKMQTNIQHGTTS